MSQEVNRVSENISSSKNKSKETTDSDSSMNKHVKRNSFAEVIFEKHGSSEKIPSPLSLPETASIASSNTSPAMKITDDKFSKDFIDQFIQNLPPPSSLESGNEDFLMEFDSAKSEVKDHFLSEHKFLSLYFIDSD